MKGGERRGDMFWAPSSESLGFFGLSDLRALLYTRALAFMSSQLIKITGSDNNAGILIMTLSEIKLAVSIGYLAFRSRGYNLVVCR